MGHAATILVVEDDLTLARMLRDVLGGEGYQVAVAYDGDAALLSAFRAPPDMVLLDIMLPGSDGIAVLRALRADHKTMHIPIIIITARSDVADKVRAFDLFVNDYLTKPFDTGELLARLRAHLHHAHSGLLSPLTLLPSGSQVELAIAQRAQGASPWAIAYLDLDHFKAFNDFYGFLLGNEMIQMLAQIVVECVQGRGNLHDFVGHVGGEDFVVITTPDRVHDVCRAVIIGFEMASRRFYRAEDLARGGFVAVGRNGQQQMFRLVTVSIAVLLPGQMRQGSAPEDLSRRLAALKAQSKDVPFSCYVIEGDGHPYVIDTPPVP
jgi:diguanylate cyclase (GGDEF)-like protein